MSVSNTKKPAFNADAAEEYFSDLLVYYRNTANDIFRRDNEGRHSTNFIYSAEYQKYVGMQIAMREVLEYFSKYDLADVQEILGDDYDLALSTLQAENVKLRAELEKVKAEFEEERAAVVDVDKAILWLKDYVFEDIYTNGTRLIPYFRVLQAFRNKAYNGLQEGRS